MTVIKKPLITEKTAIEKEAGKLYFRVDKTANKVQIKQEIEQLFGVKVASVNTISMKGKKRRYGRIKGQMADWKKAVVQLKEGEKLTDYENLF